MADFNVDLAAPHASGAKVISPVQDARTNFPNPWVAFGLGVADALIKGSEDAKKKDAELRKQTIIGEFTRSQTALSDAVQQGEDVGRVGARARANMAKFSASNPEYVNDFAKIQNELFQTTALTEVKSAEDTARELKKQNVADMQKSGYLVSDATPKNVYQPQWEAFQTSRRAEESFRQMAARNAEMRSASSEERTAFEFKAKEDATKLLAEVGDKHLNSSIATVGDILARKAASKDPNAMQTAQAEMIQHFSGIESAIVALGSRNPALIEPYKRLFADVKKYGDDVLGGKLSAEASDNELKALQNKIMLTTLADPSMKAVYGTTKVANGQQLMLLMKDSAPAVRNAFLDITSKFGGDVTNMLTDKEKASGVYKMIGTQVQAVEGGKAPDAEGTKGQLSNAANNVLSQVGSAQTISPEQLKTSFDFISSPDFQKIMSYGKVDKAAMQQAHRVFEAAYKKDITNGVEAKLAQPFREGGKLVPQGISNAELVDFSWNGAGVTASAKEVGPLSMMDRVGKDVFVRDMQSSTKMINQLVRAGSHMEGHSNYEKYWTENKHNILPNFFAPPQITPNSIHEFEGQKLKYNGQTPWKDKRNWEVVKSE